ncbi:MAG: hypothetical protein Q3990_07850 [Desulfovibrionaceae bacterium]|nr:hypothetical protein [Desulfovibrionaceae bacterium]
MGKGRKKDSAADSCRPMPEQKSKQTPEKGQQAGHATSFIRKIGRGLLHLAGLGTGIAFLRSTAEAFVKGSCSPGSPYGEQGFAQAKKLLQANLLHEDELVKAPFASVLSSWGLAEEDLPSAVHNLGREAWCGAVLLLVSLCALAGALLFPMPSFCLRFFAAAASASMSLAGLLLLLSSMWRRSVLQKRHFVPFAAWICLAGCRRRCRKKEYMQERTHS